MLIKTISFEIHDFTNHISEKFLILNTEDNQERVFTHRFTRNIKFTETFAFQFEKDMAIPVEMIDITTWMQVLNGNPELIEYFNAKEMVSA